MKRFSLALIAALALSCVTSKRVQDREFAAPSEKDQLPREPARAAVPTSTLSISKIQSADEFNALADDSTGVIRQGKTIKVLIDNRDFRKPVVYFMNANYCAHSKCASPPPEAVFHYHFAKAALKNFAMTEEAYRQNAYTTTSVQDRQFFDARIQSFQMKVAGELKTFFGIRFIERDAIRGDMFQHAIEAIAKVMRIPGQNLALVQNSITQDFESSRAWLNSQNISTFTMEQILSSVSFVGLNPGTAYGFLRVFPKNDEDLEPFDIPVFDALPLDLAVVAGTISTEFQDVGSHVNLKSKERGTPNMVVREAQKIEKLKSLDGKPVKLTVTFGDYDITEVTEKVVLDEYRKKVNKPWTQVRQTPAKDLPFFDDMCSREGPAKCLEASRSYGGKVAGLGFLAHPEVTGSKSSLKKKYSYRLSPMGYGVPLAHYNEFMKRNLQANPALRSAYERLINGEMGLNNEKPLQADERRRLIQELKTEVLKGEIPPEIYKSIHQRMVELKTKVESAYPGTALEKLKIRSSSNAEDIEGFNGAGLHDSYSARISLSDTNDPTGGACKFVLVTDDDTELTEEDIEPKSLACAIKATYASLWNLRAVRERTFKRFDHRTAAMGLSIQTAYKFRKGPKIKANSVLVTRVLGTETVYGQQISTQVKNGLVTNPPPGTKAELAVISFDIEATNVGINLLQFAKPKPDQPALQAMILPQEEMLRLSEIARDVEIKYCESKPTYFPGHRCKNVVNSQRKPFALDMEFKIFDNGEILIKQVRTFSGR